MSVSKLLTSTRPSSNSQPKFTPTSSLGLRAHRIPLAEGKLLEGPQGKNTPLSSGKGCVEGKCGIEKLMRRKTQAKLGLLPNDTYRPKAIDEAHNTTCTSQGSAPSNLPCRMARVGSQLQIRSQKAFFREGSCRTQTASNTKILLNPPLPNDKG